MQAMPATTRAPRATLHRELRHPPAQNVPRDSLNPTDSVRTCTRQAPLQDAPNRLGLNQTKKKIKKKNKLYPD